ncbi:hypothetical protein N7G274_005004 [Stereocaulon virgatum]|uniref:Uncharacterized protein n=1 Tax=Stereocaulon virgatum TaxID=373712 RepID=A0ABR4ACC5_9LECA
MKHLGGGLHCLEDFAAHSNYVKLCLRMIGQREPASGLRDVFVYVGDATTATTAAGSAPPLVTGSFGPLDLYVSLLGELDNQVASGSLSELDMRMGSVGGPLASNVNKSKFFSKEQSSLELKFRQQSPANNLCSIGGSQVVH